MNLARGLEVVLQVNPQSTLQDPRGHRGFSVAIPPTRMFIAPTIMA